MQEIQTAPIETRVVLHSLRSEDEHRRTIMGPAAVKRNITIAGVTAEAREVLEQFLQRSLSDVNQRGRPGGLQRQPLTAIVENERIVSSQGAQSSDRAKMTNGASNSHHHTSRSVTNGSADVINNFNDVDHMSVDDSLAESTPQLPEAHWTLISDQLTSSRMLAQPEASDLTDAEEEFEGDAPKKKKKSFFTRARERLRATFRRQTDREKSHANVNDESTRKERSVLFVPIRRKSKKAEQIRDGTLDGDHAEVTKPRKVGGKNDVKKRSDSAQQSELPRSKNLFASLQRRMSSRRIKRSQSKG